MIPAVSLHLINHMRAPDQYFGPDVVCIKIKLKVASKFTCHKLHMSYVFLHSTFISLIFCISYEYYLRNKKFSFCGHYCKEKQRLQMTHFLFYLELKIETQGHITISHYNTYLGFFQDNVVDIANLSHRLTPCNVSIS